MCGGIYGTLKNDMNGNFKKNARYSCSFYILFMNEVTWSSQKLGWALVDQTGSILEANLNKNRHLPYYYLELKISGHIVAYP